MQKNKFTIIVRTNVLTSLKELTSLMSLKWIEPSILGFKQTKKH